MRSLAEFASFVREEHLEEYAVAELKLLDTKTIPLMKLFAHLTADQLKEMTVMSLGQFLNGFEKGTAFEKATESLRKWNANEIPGVSKDSIHPSDLVFVYYVQKVSLLNFLPLFSSDPYEIIHIVAELEDYYSQIQDNSIQLLFKLQKEAEDNLIKKTKELERSNDDLQRFASVSSHDLKEPLRKIQTFADLLADTYKDSANEETKSYTNRILISCARMERAIDDLLLYSKVDAKKETFVKVDLKKLIKEIIDDYEVTIKQKDAKIVVEDLPEIFAAPSEMRQLFQNLISNALKFNKPNIPSIIRISSKLEENKNKISIKDNGIGFDEKYTAKIFEVFQRLHSKDQYEGSGIGLSICKKIVEKHQGKITVESKPNEGATFSISLPIIIKE